MLLRRKIRMQDPQIRFDDAVFIETAGNLDRTLNLLKGYLPFLFLIVLLTGYVVPHLLLQGRKRRICSDAGAWDE